MPIINIELAFTYGRTTILEELREDCKFVVHCYIDIHITSYILIFRPRPTLIHQTKMGRKKEGRNSLTKETVQLTDKLRYAVYLFVRLSSTHSIRQSLLLTYLYSPNQLPYELLPFLVLNKHKRSS